MRILIALTYYRPHYSGLTIYVERLARAFAKQGHHVSILTSRYDHTLLKQETVDEVQINRLHVSFRISKGVIMLEMPFMAWKFVRQAEVVNLHVPQFDAALLAIISKLLMKPVVLTYHCDMRLPSGFIHRLANYISNLVNHIAAQLADVIVTNTLDYAQHSPFLRRYIKKVEIIPPPVELPTANVSHVMAFKKRVKILYGQRIIGVAARLATEKGIEYLVAAMPEIIARHPQSRVLFVGQYQNVIGEEAYTARLAQLIAKLGEHWTFLGVLPPEEFVAFLTLAEVTVLPSINSTESYGMVQIESMICNTPVVATDLPGVRQPVMTSGMGIIVPPANSKLLANAIIKILDHPKQFSDNSQMITDMHSPHNIVEKYERIFQRL